MIPKAIEYYDPDAVKLLRKDDLFFVDTDGFLLNPDEFDDGRAVATAGHAPS
mgnify:CR=1 FL=1